MLNKQTAMDRVINVLDEIGSPCYTTGQVEAMADELLAVQAETLEAAAKVAEAQRLHWLSGVHADSVAAHACRMTANAIRNLKAPADAALTGKEG